MEPLTIAESYCARDGRLFSFRGHIEQIDEDLFRPFDVLVIDKQLSVQWPLDLGYIQCDREELRNMFRAEVRLAIDRTL